MRLRARRARRTAAALAAIVAVAAAVVVLSGDDDDPPADALVALDVAVIDVEARWNDVVGELEVGDVLPTPTWVADEAIGLEVFEHGLDDWGLLELYRRPGGAVAAIDLVGSHLTAADQDRFRGNATAAVAAALDLDADRAGQLVLQDLGLEDAAAAETEVVEHRGARVTLTRDGTTAQIRISGA